MADSIVVLHVDDEPDFAELAAQFLERADDRLEVITETSADAGLERLDDGADVDCIVSDYDMPKLNGLDFLERVRERDPDRPFILFTGKGSEEVASEALSKGATDYLQKKPGREQYEILANRVLNYVETARTAAQRRRQLDAIESANEGIAILDADGSYIYVNRAYADLYGYEADEMQGQHWTLVYPDDQADWVREQILPEIREEGAWRGELAGLRADDSSFVKDLSVSTTGHGEVICTVRDVTEHRERKQALERYRTIVEAMGDGVYALDAQGKPIHANDVVLDMLGYDYESFLTVDLAELYDPTDIERFEDAIRDLLADEGKRLETVRATVESADGERIPIEVSLTLLPMPDGEFRGTVGVMRDIRDRIDRERELETYRNAFESALSPIAIADADQRLIAVNEAFLDLWGYEDEESVLGRHVSEYWADPAEAASVADEVAATGEWRGQLEAELADGSTKPVECAASVITDEDGELTGLVSAFLDASERATKAAELERYETLLEVVPDTVVVTDLEGIIQDIHGFEGWSGYEYDELVGEHMSKTLPPASIEAAENTVADLVLNEDRTTATFEQVTVTKDGERLPQENHITLLPPDEDGNIQGTMSVLRDISERKQRERELERQNERLEEFAGIVSHDLRNPLNVAAGRLELARENVDSPHLESLEAALQRMETLIEDLLALAREREDVAEFETLHLADVVESSWEAVSSDEATLEVDADRTLRADESRLKQLLENLLRNAVEHGSTSPPSGAREDAVEHGDGPVTVRVGTLENGGGFYVADDGPGIPEGEREAVFQSGYSTDESGTGFGLSIVEDVAAAHGWDVHVTDSDRGGARFEIVWTDGTD